ncbi:MAG: histidine phosphotransferase family protein [Pseudomonadota bacterium]
MNSPDLSSLVSARFCHDLISPLGAIGNGLELLEMSGGGAAELDLINDSLSNALAKLRFFRVAFGPSDPETSLTFEEANEITGAMFSGRLTVTWTQTSGSVGRTTAQLLFLAVLCLEKSLPMGGRISVSASGEDASLGVDAPRLSAPSALWSHVTDGTEIATPKSDSVQFPMLRQRLLATEHKLEAEFRDQTADLGLRRSFRKNAA